MIYKNCPAFDGKMIGHTEVSPKQTHKDNREAVKACTSIRLRVRGRRSGEGLQCHRQHAQDTTNLQNMFNGTPPLLDNPMLRLDFLTTYIVATCCRGHLEK